MTRSLSAENYAALQARTLVARDFIWFVVRDRDDGSPVTDGYWSGAGTITADVVDPDTGGTSSRQFFGAYSLIQISDIPLVSTLTVRNVTVTLSQVSDRINDLVRTYDCKQGQVQIFRGLFDPVSRALVAPAAPRFVGFIDEAPIKTPKEGEAGDVTLTCTSHTQEMTRSNTDTRSDVSQRLRSATDNFFGDTAVVGTWQQFWAKEGGPIRSSSSIGPGSLVRNALSGR
jgi:hypothetical protein